MYIHARVKGPYGSITLDPKSKREGSAEIIAKIDGEARTLYQNVHGPNIPDEDITVDIKVTRNR